MAMVYPDTAGAQSWLILYPAWLWHHGPAQHGVGWCGGHGPAARGTLCSCLAQLTTASQHAASWLARGPGWAPNENQTLSVNAGGGQAQQDHGSTTASSCLCPCSSTKHSPPPQTPHSLAKEGFLPPTHACPHALQMSSLGVLSRHVLDLHPSLGLRKWGLRVCMQAPQDLFHP